MLGFEAGNRKEVVGTSSLVRNPRTGKVAESIGVLYQADDPARWIEDRYFGKWGAETIAMIIGVSLTLGSLSYYQLMKRRERSD